MPLLFSIFVWLVLQDSWFSPAFLLQQGFLAEKAKEKALFRTQRKAVEAGAHGTLDYTIKEGVNKNIITPNFYCQST